MAMSTQKTVSSGADLQGYRREVGVTSKGCKDSIFSVIDSTSVNNKPFQNTSLPNTHTCHNSIFRVPK